MRALLTLAMAALWSGMSLAGAPRVVDATVRHAGEFWRVDVTVAHDDTGWSHFADGWIILAPDGRELGYRELTHPHVNEQPFTRSLSGVLIPTSTDRLVIRVHDSVHGWGPGFVLLMPGVEEEAAGGIEDAAGPVPKGAEGSDKRAP